MTQVQPRPTVTTSLPTFDFPSNSPVTKSAVPAPARRSATLIDRALELNARYAPVLLRLALAGVFIWFGALKVAGISPVHDLIAATLPWFPAHIIVPALGGVELAIGAALVVGRLPRVTLLVLAGHLVGTFLTFITATSWVIEDDNPLKLTASGEFVVKNLVLISAAMVLVGWYSRGKRHA
jgi:uncharacterized membrane protein YphA (DoxX/SURF4 family)